MPFSGGWARYLVQTRDLHLVFRPPPPPAPNFSACSDSSLINAPITAVSMPDVAGSSYGGFALYFEGSGAFSVECFSPRRLADSSAGAELIMATWAGKSVVAFQMLQKELGMPRLLPTPLQIDASAVTDGVKWNVCLASSVFKQPASVCYASGNWIVSSNC